MKMDKIDELILKNLLVDGSSSSRKLALKLGLSTVTVLNRITKLEKEKIIKGYTTILDHEKIGYDLTAIIEVKTSTGRMKDIEEEIAMLENVCAVYDVTGTTDVILIAKFKGRGDLSKFVKEISAIKYVESTNTRIVLNSIKEDFRLS